MRVEKGKVVQIHRGPAAVIGDESCFEPFAGVIDCVTRGSVLGGEGAATRMIRKPEDLPVAVG